MSEGYNNIPTHILYPERRIIGWQHVIDKSAGSYRHRMPTAVENLDPATLEIADKQPRSQRGLHNGNSPGEGPLPSGSPPKWLGQVRGSIPNRLSGLLP